MEKKLRETLNEALDRLLQVTLRKRYCRLMSREFLSLVNSQTDFLFGLVVGDMLEGLGFCTYGAHKRSPNDKEFRELFKIIQERSKEIYEKIESIEPQNEVD
ncbi:hypothetical protein E3J51_03825 [Candidatus Bathyarchaeota archaeon]|nr:MAG: hypothetical protein E3J51_03825 [Candidatus Bathyarchaeota archaeon]